MTTTSILQAPSFICRASERVDTEEFLFPEAQLGIECLPLAVSVPHMQFALRLRACHQQPAAFS